MIYLDHAATTPVHDEIIDEMYQVEREVFGNPSSLHAFGRKAKAYLNRARQFLAESINANENEIIFTSGGTEANNLRSLARRSETNIAAITSSLRRRNTMRSSIS